MAIMGFRSLLGCSYCFLAGFLLSGKKRFLHPRVAVIFWTVDVARVVSDVFGIVSPVLLFTRIK